MNEDINSRVSAMLVHFGDTVRLLNLAMVEKNANFGKFNESQICMVFQLYIIQTQAIYI